jgi:hypothetical protein
MIAEPFADGSVQVTVTLPVPEVTSRSVGASGADAGMMAEVGIDRAEVAGDPLAVELVIALNV